MLNGEGSVNGIKINRSKYQKNNNKGNLHVQHALLCIPLPLFSTVDSFLK